MSAARLLLRQSACQRLLRRPSVVPSTTSFLRKQAFHATSPRKVEAVPEALPQIIPEAAPEVLPAILNPLFWVPHELFDLLHSAMPWYAAIPAGAFLLRSFLVISAGSWTRQSTTRYTALEPLRSAMAIQIRHQVLSREGRKGFTKVNRMVNATIALETRKLHRRWRCSIKGQVFWVIVQLPYFLGMVEIVRRMAGARSGLLGMGMSAIGLERYTSRQEQAVVDAQSSNISESSQSFEDSQLQDIFIDQPQLGSIGKEMSEAGDTNLLVHENNPFFEPTLAQEGMLWFPDLMVPDPYGALPFVVSALMVSNILISSQSVGAVAVAKGPKALKNFMLGVALLIGPLTQHVPAAVLLYWASSTVSVIGWNFWLDRRYPAPTGHGKCARPLQAVNPKKGRA